MPTDEDATNCESIKLSLPYPGDGICPSEAQFNAAVRAGHELWSSLASDTKDNTDFPSTVDCLFDLLRHVPAFSAQHSEAFSILDEPLLQVKYALEWTTTTDATCDQPVKRTYHYLSLGILEPVGFEFLDASEACPYWPGIKADRAHHLSYLILGWSYILSCRWAEILQDAGEEVLFQQSKELSHDSFWEVIAGSRWQAMVVRGGRAFYAPWSLAPSKVAPRPHLLKVSPQSSIAIDILVDYCASEGVAREYVAALAIVLTLPQRNNSPLMLPFLTTCLKIDTVQSRNDGCYKSLYDRLDSCITLSCSSEGLDSLLCGVFYEPTVPCNLVGAHLLGVTKALEPLQSNPQIFAALMAKKCPKVSPLWLATIWNGQMSRVLKSALGGLPPISLPAASWTGTIQSFLQVRYSPITNRRDVIPRAYEYSLTYLVRPDVTVPFTPSPPFGETTTSNLSLEIKAHLGHHHRPILHKTSWMLESDEELLVQRGSDFVLQPHLHLPLVARVDYVEEMPENVAHSEANAVSCDASFNLFNWYRNIEGGLWLAEGSEDNDTVRRYHSHPWIRNDSDEEDVLEGNETEYSVNQDIISRWRNGLPQ